MVRGTDKTNPVSVQEISTDLAELMRSLPEIWVEGQLTEVKIRPGSNLAFLSLRDLDSEMSLQIACLPSVLKGLGNDTSEGQRVVIRAKTEFWTKRGSLMMRASAIESFGVGDYLARLAELQERLRKEGLFDIARKKSPPLVPKKVGLICGRASDAMHDVINNSRRRWPSVQFEVREVAVQGVSAVREVSDALLELDDYPEVEVIVIARGGGAFEDLMVFSDESMLRVVAECQTPVVSAIGHEEDSPLLDLVADLRASTPTDAARLIVPDVDIELDNLDSLRARAGRVIGEVIDRAFDEIDRTREQARRAVTSLVSREAEWLAGARGQLRALSPLATLARGYAILRTPDGHVVTSRVGIASGQAMTATLTDGELDVVTQ
ncbi:MAG: exodeoxyribonuclease VII large subunit [Actinobacteria bacterium]|nr:exodeoxyribonuclease VII large subunit [Actinomycetota bacterium]